ERVWEDRARDAAVLFSPELRPLYRAEPHYTTSLLTALLDEQTSPDGTPEQNRQCEMCHGQPGASSGPATKTYEHTCGDLDESTWATRFDLEIQNTLSLADNLRLVSVLNYRRDHAESKAYFSGARHKDIGRLHGQLEWYPHPQWLLQAGAM